MTPDAVRIDRIARLEKIKATAAALQAAESVRFDSPKQRSVGGRYPSRRDLAADCRSARSGPARYPRLQAARRLGVARALWFDLPETSRLLVAGEISEYVATLGSDRVAAFGRQHQTRCGREDHRRWDFPMGPRSAAACARRYAMRPIPTDMSNEAGPNGRTVGSTSKGRLWWRRLYAAPVGGPLVGGDPHRRRFDGYLRS